MINEVRNAVLSILNKNNYGYISPSDFNLLATNAQMELYEEYYSSYNKVINAENARTSGTDYADVEQPIAETLESFLVSDYLVNLGNNSFSIPTLTTVGNDSYYIIKLLCYPNKLKSGVNTATTAPTPTAYLIDSTATFLSDGISVGDIVVNTTTGLSANVLSLTLSTNTNLALTVNIFTTTPSNYSILKASTLKEADKVSLGKITMLNASSLTKPTEFYPSYTLEGQTIKIYPSTINDKGQVQAVYFRYPKTPKWTYITLVSGEPAFDQSQPDYQDFELPNEDGYKLVTKILEYCGIEIREFEVSQFGTAQQQHEQPTFSMQQ
jgi:hypothetical protein